MMEPVYRYRIFYDNHAGGTGIDTYTTRQSDPARAAREYEIKLHVTVLEIKRSR